MKIGIDLGGSHIGIGLVDGDKILTIKDKIFTREDRKNIKECIINEIQRMVVELLVENYLKKEDIEVVGLASPGTISNGKIVRASNLNIFDFDIKNILEAKLGMPVIVRNDAKCAALAEKKFGAIKDYEDCVFLAIGTGIGGAVFMDNKLLEPKRYSGFEFGHMVVNKGGRACTCGKKGCFETYSSIKALKMKVTETLDMDSDISGQYLREQLLIKDHPGVKEDIELFLEYMKVGICNLIDIFEPQVVCFGGSFSYYEGNPVLAKLYEKLKEPGSTFNGNPLPDFVTATYKNNAGIIGATIE